LTQNGHICPDRNIAYGMEAEKGGWGLIGKLPLAIATRTSLTSKKRKRGQENKPMRKVNDEFTEKKT